MEIVQENFPVDVITDTFQHVLHCNYKNIDIISPHCFYLKEEQRRQHRKIARKEKKQKTAVDDGDIDPDLAATMGFSGFGSTKK